MEYRVLGRLEVVRNGDAVDLGPPRQRALLALLLANANNTVSTDRLINELWGDDASSDRQNSLWVYVSNLRKALDPEREPRTEGTVLLTRAPGYRLQVQESDIDADRFERMVAEGRAMLETDPAAASLTLGEALALWHGRAFEDFAYDDFAQAEIARLEELRLEAVEHRVDADLRRGMSRELVSELDSLVRQHPTRERLTGQLMLALHRSGRQAEALRAYQLLKSRLGEELGIEPSDQLRGLEERMVMSDPSLLEATTRMPASGPEPGMAIRGYELREKLGEGGFGVVYRAYQPAIGREVAIKVIHPELADNPAFIRRFEEEAQLVARLEHPHIIPLYDYWREPGAAFLVMRYMRGGNLDQALATGPLEVAEVRTLVEQVGSALDTAHRNGIVHRDIKPANILRDEAGNAYLSDFGIATGAGQDLGPANALPSTLTAPYASPQQLESGVVTQASDVYSFAVVVAHALAGRAGAVQELRVGLSPAAAEVIGDATSQVAEVRYPDAGAFTAALLDALGAEETPILGAVVNPYKGLRAFGQADADDFFGRERLVERLVSRLGQPDVRGRFVALVGPSGCGKSSVVRAGLLPALRAGAAPDSERWFQVEMTPGHAPYEELAAALLGIAVDPPPTLLEHLKGDNGIRRVVNAIVPEDQQLVVVVDQLEELFTQSHPETTNRFLDALADAITNRRGRIRVVITLRADFYDRPLQHRRFGELLRDGTEVITPMTPDELERAISGPAARMGVGFEPALVAQMVADVADRPTALPLLQYALTEVFERRLGTVIPARAYEELGGVSGALVERAEALYQGFTTDQQDAAGQLLLRLVTVGESAAGDTRRRALLSELTGLAGAGPHAQPFIDTFGRHRLVAFDRDPLTRGPTVEISHEALLREWARLGGWIDDARDDLLAQRRLAAAAREWADRDRPTDYTFTGAQLARFDGWLVDPPVQLTAQETEFLQAGAARQAEIESHEAQEALRETRLRTRSRLLAGLSAVFVIVVALAVFAWIQRQSAQDAEAEAADAAQAAIASEAEARQAEAATALALSNLAVTEAELRVVQRSQWLASQSLAVRVDDPELALMLAIEAGRAGSESGIATPEALDAIHWALQESGFRYPASWDTPIAVRGGPEGARGVFAVAPAELIAHAQGEVSRGFEQAECDQYFASLLCPDPRDPVDGDLEIFGGQEAYGVAALSPDALEGTTVVLRTTFSGDEMIELERALTEATGVNVFVLPIAITPVHAAEGIEGPIDIVGAPQPAVIQDLGRAGLAVDLDHYLDPASLRQSYGEFLTSLMSIADGETPPQIYGVPVELDVKSLMWHPGSEFSAAGYTAPETWEDMMGLADSIVGDGEAPFCLTIGANFATGWPATDWVETIVLRSQGPEFYDAWVTHSVPFNHPAVVEAIATLGEMVHTPGYSRYQPGLAVERSFTDAWWDLVGLEPPGCWLAPIGSFAPGLATELDLVPGEDYGVFPFPTIDPAYQNAMVGGGAYAAAVSDRPEVRAVMRAMIQPDFGATLASLPDGEWLPAHLGFDLSSFPTEAQRTVARAARDAVVAGSFRFDGSDVMPSAIGSATEMGRGAFWTGMVKFFQEGTPDNYRELAAEVAAEIEAAWVALESDEVG